MITKYSSAPIKYDLLFKEATNRLNELYITKENPETKERQLYDYENGIRIETLEEYFHHLRDFIYGNDETEAAIGTNFDPQDGYKFLKLPLDEPHFIINANERSIKVPDEFKKNGISVLGDEVAEILFFEVDRFYDSTDLSQTEIAIQWQHTGSKEVSYTPSFIHLIESRADNNDDKLIFGWPITSEITKQAGKLSFSVRFFIRNTDDPEYAAPVFSLSTNTEVVNINPGLSLDIVTLEADNTLDLILNKRIQNSPIGEIDPPKIPYFIYAVTKIGEEYTFTPISKKETFEINEQIVDDVTIAALGFKLGSGSLSYAWYSNEGGTGNLTTLSGYQAVIDNGIYIPVTELFTNPQIGTYYIQDNMGNYQAIVIDGEEEFAEIAQENTIYILCSFWTLTAENVEPGYYFPRLTNTLYGLTAYDDQTSNPIWHVHGATKPTDLVGSWEVEAENKIIRIGAAGKDLTISGSNISEANTHYEWQKDLATDTIVDNVNKLNFSVDEGSDNDTYFIFEEGYYRVRVINTMNNSTEEETSDYVLALHDIEDFGVTISVAENILTANLTREAEKFETITYEWKDFSGNVLGNAQTCTMTEAQSYQITVTITKGNTNKTYTASHSVN